MDPQELGKRISEKRKTLSLTQKQLAEVLHITDKAVSKWERGMNYPDMDLIEPLATSLKMSPAELLGLEHAKVEEIVENVSLIAKVETNKIRKSMNVLKAFMISLFAALLIIGLVFTGYSIYSQQYNHGYYRWVSWNDTDKSGLKNLGSIDGCQVYSYNISELYYINFNAKRTSLKDFLKNHWLDKDDLMLGGKIENKRILNLPTRVYTFEGIKILDTGGAIVYMNYREDELEVMQLLQE